MAIALVVLTATALGYAAKATAATIQVFGAGSAVTSANAIANFESVASLFNNPYLEGGLSFQRVNLSNNNDGCGFAGCSTHPGFFPGFTGNYMYGQDSGGVAFGYLSLQTTGGQLFHGLEFWAGTGYDPVASPSGFWETYHSGTLVGSGSFSLATGASLVGFIDPLGFDELRYASGLGTPLASHPGIDSVRADITAVPEPASLVLLSMGVTVVVARRVQRRRR